MTSIETHESMSWLVEVFKRIDREVHMRCVLLPMLTALSLSGCSALAGGASDAEKPRFSMIVRLAQPEEASADPKYIVTFIPLRSGEDVAASRFVLRDAEWIAHSKRGSFDTLEPIPFGDELDKEPTTHDYLSSGTFVAMRCTRESSSTFRLTVRIYEFQGLQMSWQVERELVLQDGQIVPL